MKYIEEEKLINFKEVSIKIIKSFIHMLNYLLQLGEDDKIIEITKTDNRYIEGYDSHYLTSKQYDLSRLFPGGIKIDMQVMVISDANYKIEALEEERISMGHYYMDVEFHINLAIRNPSHKHSQILIYHLESNLLPTLYNSITYALSSRFDALVRKAARDEIRAVVENSK